jgi:HemX protein
MGLYDWFFALAFAFYAISCLKSFQYFRTLEENYDQAASRWILGGLALHLSSLAGRWSSQGYAPLTTFYEILSVLAFCLAASLASGRLKAKVPLLSSLFLPFILFLTLAALFTPKASHPLSPQLATAPMAAHIFLTLLGYSCFTLGFGVGVAYWVQEGQLKRHQLKKWTFSFPALDVLDQLTVFYTAMGFLFWAGGLALGVAQAFQLWNRLPLSDPKILGSFLVLVIYGVFFLVRWGFQMRGRKTMALVLAGYLLALFTFIGVRLFLISQHTFN